MEGWRCVRMEDFHARDWEADEFCTQKVAECDLFICVLGALYGSVHQRTGLSYTEREYDAAVVASRPRLMFLSPRTFRFRPISWKARPNRESRRSSASG